MRGLYQVAMGAWFGVALFFTFMVTLAVFSTLPLGTAGTVLSALFPRFYAFTLGAGVVAMVAGIFTPGHTRWLWGPSLLALLLQVYAWIVLFPQVQKAVGTAAFGRLHGLSLGLDLIATIIVVVGLAASGFGVRRKD